MSTEPTNPAQTTGDQTPVVPTDTSGSPQVANREQLAAGISSILKGKAPLPPPEDPAPVNPDAPPPDTPPNPNEDAQTRNWRELNKVKDAAVRDNKQHVKRIAELEKQLAELSQRPTPEDVQTRLSEKESALSAALQHQKSLEEKVFRADARLSKEWQERDGLIAAARDNISAILKLPEVTDVGRYSLEDLSKPEYLNEVLSALHEGRKFAQADELKTALTAMSFWSREQQDLEQKAAAQRQQWATQRSTVLQRQFAEASQRVPSLWRPETEEFKSLPPEAQKVITDARQLAMQTVTNALSGDPEEAAHDFFLAVMGEQMGTANVRYMADHAKALEGQLAALTKEKEAIASRLAAYEKDLSRPAGQVGSGDGPRPGGGQSREELAESLKKILARKTG